MSYYPRHKFGTFIAFQGIARQRLSNEAFLVLRQKTAGQCSIVAARSKRDAINKITRLEGMDDAGDSSRRIHDHV